MDQSNTDQLTNVGLEMDNDARRSFGESAKWAKFISIVVFIFCGIFLLLGIAGGSIISRILERYSGSAYGNIFAQGGAIIIGVIIFVILIVCVIYYFLFNFSRKMKSALMSENAEQMSAGLNSLKIYFIIVTILTALSLLSSLRTIF